MYIMFGKKKNQVSNCYLPLSNMVLLSLITHIQAIQTEKAMYKFWHKKRAKLHTLNTQIWTTNIWTFLIQYFKQVFLTVNYTWQKHIAKEHVFFFLHVQFWRKKKKKMNNLLVGVLSPVSQKWANTSARYHQISYDMVSIENNYQSELETGVRGFLVTIF